MKICVCISGIPKFYLRSFEFLNKNLLSNFENVDIFFHCWENNISDLEKEKLLHTYKPKKTIFEQQKQHIINYPYKQSKTLPNNLFSQFYSIMKSNELKKEYELENNFEYDWCFRYRFDYALNQKIDLNCLNNLDNDFVYVNNYEKIGNPHCADCFGFSSSKNMNIYSETYNNMMSYGKDGVILAGENMLYNQLIKNNLKLKIFDVSHPFEPDYKTAWCKHSLIRE